MLLVLLRIIAIHTPDFKLVKSRRLISHETMLPTPAHNRMTIVITLQLSHNSLRLMTRIKRQHV